MAKKTAKNKLPVATDKPVPVAVVSTGLSSKPTKEDKDREMKYRAEDALRDIERAEGHKKDGELMGHVKKLAKEKIGSLKKI